jgi:hypothetical protein
MQALSGNERRPLDSRTSRITNEIGEHSGYGRPSARGRRRTLLLTLDQRDLRCRRKTLKSEDCTNNATPTEALPPIGLQFRTNFLRLTGSR